MVILPFAIGYLIALLLQKVYKIIFPPPYEPVYHDPPRPMTIWEKRYTWIREEPERPEIPMFEPQPEKIEEVAKEDEEHQKELEEQEPEVEKEPEEEFTLNRNFYVERKLSH